jgi:SPRY domain
MSADKGGIGYHSNGNRYIAGSGVKFGPTYNTGDVIGTLINMNHRTVTFYKNGVRVGTAIGRDQLTEDIYYPCVAMYTLGDKVVSCESPTPF